MLRTLLVVALVGVAGCGGDDEPRPGTDGGGYRDATATDSGGGGTDAWVADGAPPPVDSGGGGGACGTQTCGPYEVCVHLVSCPVPTDPGPEPTCVPLPRTCATPSCDCFEADPCGGCAACGGVEGGDVTCDCTCVCAAPDTAIATPSGDRPIASLAAGDLVYSMHHRRLVPVPLLRAGHVAAPRHHAIVRVTLATGAVLEISPGHPTADGRSFGDLAPGAQLDGVGIQSVELVPYERPFTYDILPDSDTGTYVAGGVLIGSTMHRD